MEIRPGHQALGIGDNLTIPADEFRIQALNFAGAASPEDRAGADFIAASLAATPWPTGRDVSRTPRCAL